VIVATGRIHKFRIDLPPIMGRCRILADIIANSETVGVDPSLL